MRNYLNNLYNATCCTLVSDDFSDDTVDQYSFWGLDGADELTVADGKLTIPNGGRLRRNNCIDRVKGIRITVSTAPLDRDHSLSIFFWCSSDLTSGYQIRIHSNAGIGGDVERKGCLVELCNAGGSVLKSRFEGANSSINIVEAWADQESGDAFITVNNSFSWKITYFSALAEDGYFGIGTPGDKDDLEVESYTAVLVGSTDETMGCIGECSHVTPVNACTHTEPCNGGTLDEDFYTSSDITPNVAGWLVSADDWGPGPGVDNPSPLWSPDGLNITMAIPENGNCAAGAYRFYRNVGDARRLVRVTSCANEVTLSISIAKSVYRPLAASITLAPICGTDYSDSLSESWSGTLNPGDPIPCDESKCDSDDTDTVSKTIYNLPVGIYLLLCETIPTNVLNLCESDAGGGLAGVTVEFTVSGVEEYQKLC